MAQLFSSSNGSSSSRPSIVTLPLTSTTLESTTRAAVTTEAPDMGEHRTKAAYGVTAFLVFAVVLLVLLFIRRRCVRMRRSRGGSSNRSSATSHNDEEVEEVVRDPKLHIRDPERAAAESVPEPWRALPDNVKYLLKGHVIDIRRIVLGSVIGKGHFGCVYEATLLPSPLGTTSNNYVQTSGQKRVAAKTLKGDNLGTETLETFLREGMIMKDLEHRHVLTLLGVAIDARGVPLIVLPYMQHGCLKKYIRSPEILLTVRDLLSFGQQVADGMRYLAEKKFVHRDLAARNCMLDENLNVKVADFGLSRDIFLQDYYTSEDRKTKLPVKWMSPESLTRAVYSTKSDVWSYGVLLWELLTRGATPYPDVSVWDVRVYIQAGRRMEKPEVCPDEVYDLMLRCWDLESRRRPSFDDIYTQLDQLLHPPLADNEDEGQDEGGTMEHDYINIYQSVTAANNATDDELGYNEDKFTLEEFSSRGQGHENSQNQGQGLAVRQGHGDEVERIRGEDHVLLDSRDGAVKLNMSRLGSEV